jgi:hypothetical protein
MELAPIVLFVYNRPWHTRQTLEALTKNDLADQSKLYIYSDGPNQNASPKDKIKLQEVRAIIREKKWCGEVIIKEKLTNSGLANSIIDGVTEVISTHGKAIVLEDDLICGRGFLKFMNDSLTTFDSVQNVWSISGYMFPIKNNGSLRSVLIPYVFTWGWGTWLNRWESFIKTQDSYDQLLNSKVLYRIFNLADYNYRSILKNNLETSWGIRWYHHIFSCHGLSVFPTQTLVANIGKDGTGTNYKSKVYLEDELNNNFVDVSRTSIIDLGFWDELLFYFSNKGKKNFFTNVFSKKN